MLEEPSRSSGRKSIIISIKILARRRVVLSLQSGVEILSRIFGDV